MTDQAICVFFKNFNGDEEITETQAERNALREELAEVRHSERELRKQVGQLNARIKGLEAEVARGHHAAVREVAVTQIVALKAKVDALPAATKDK
jgi:predicted  nucleic acid-binding Zn-ribbon protein